MKVFWISFIFLAFVSGTKKYIKTAPSKQNILKRQKHQVAPKKFKISGKDIIENRAEAPDKNETNAAAKDLTSVGNISLNNINGVGPNPTQ